MNSIYWWRKPKPPTPLEVATADFIATQHDLLAAHKVAEDATATVEVLRERLKRLRDTIRDLSNPPTEEGEEEDSIVIAMRELRA